MTVIQKNLDKERNVIRFSIPNRTLKFYTIRKSLISSVDFEFLKTSGVYILFDEKFSKVVYIGETDRPDGMQARILEHINEKDEYKKKKFEWITFIVSSDPCQPLSSIRFKLEYSLIDDYRPGKNSSLGKPCRLSEDDYESYLEIYEMIKEFLDQVYHLKPGKMAIGSFKDKDIEEDPKGMKGKRLIDDLGLKKGDFIYFLRYHNSYFRCYSRNIASPGAYGSYAYRGKVESNYLIGDVDVFALGSYKKSCSYKDLYTVDGITGTLYNKDKLNGYKYWGLEDGTTLDELIKKRKK